MSRSSPYRLDAWSTGAWVRTALDGADFLVLATDADGAIRFCAGPVHRYLGYEPEQLLGCTLPELSDASEIAQRAGDLSRSLGQPVEPGWEAFVVRALNGQSDEFDWIARHRDGEPFTARLTVLAVQENDQLTGFTFVARDLSGQRRVEQALRESEDRFRGAFEHSAIGMALVSPEGWWLQANPAFCRMLGYTEEELRLLTFADVSHPDDVGASITHDCELLGGARDTYQMRKRYLRKDGSIVWVILNASLVRGTDRRPLHFVAQILDVTAQHRAEEALRESEERFRDLFENASDLILCADATGQLLYVNRAWCEKLGYTEREARSLTLARIIHPDDLDRCRHLFGRLAAGEPRVTFEANFVTRDGQIVVAEGNVSCSFRDGKPTLTRGIFRDVTDRRTTERLLDDYRRNLEEANSRLAAANARLGELATTDALTGLKNRLLLHQQLEEEHRRALRYEVPLSLILLDVDHFKAFNDSFGHPAGDEVLRRLAAVLRGTARETDIVARFGGEEFAVLLPSTDAEGAFNLAERFRVAIETTAWEQRAVTASFGVAACTPQMEEAGVLVSAADAALYRAKQAGRNRVEAALEMRVIKTV